jgi:lipid-binding SYLF domain-containing protein
MSVGVAWGLLAGANLVDRILILNDDASLALFMAGGNLALGGSVDLALGGLGRCGRLGIHMGLPPDENKNNDNNSSASVSPTETCSHSAKAPLPVAPVTEYNHSLGLYGGVALEGR